MRVKNWIIVYFIMFFLMFFCIFFTETRCEEVLPMVLFIEVGQTESLLEEIFVRFVPMTTRLLFLFYFLMGVIKLSIRKRMQHPIRKPAFWGAKHRMQTPRGDLTDEHMFCII